MCVTCVCEWVSEWVSECVCKGECVSVCLLIFFYFYLFIHFYLFKSNDNHFPVLYILYILYILIDLYFTVIWISVYYLNTYHTPIMYVQYSILYTVHTAFIYYRERPLFIPPQNNYPILKIFQKIWYPIVNHWLGTFVRDGQNISPRD